MKKFFKGLLIFLALIGVGVVSAFAVIALLLRQEEVRVPDLIRRDIVTVIETLNQQGLQLSIDRRESSSDVPRDAVISQMPAAGNGIKKGRQVHVVVSLGPSNIQAPRVVGEHFRKADIMIRQAGFFPGLVSRISSETVERDMVIAQDPLPGGVLETGGKISLLVSSGKKTKILVMPKLIGKKAEEAVLIVDRMGLQYQVTYKSQGDKPASPDRIVIHQKPGAGGPVSAGALVSIIASK